MAIRKTRSARVGRAPKIKASRAPATRALRRVRAPKLGTGSTRPATRVLSKGVAKRNRTLGKRQVPAGRRAKAPRRGGKASFQPLRRTRKR